MSKPPHDRPVLYVDFTPHPLDEERAAERRAQVFLGVLYRILMIVLAVVFLLAVFSLSCGRRGRVVPMGQSTPEHAAERVPEAPRGTR